ncbi:MAG TPA: multicopper oxidase domain-containing protein [Terracidiphilus sp.]|nr:multicopper oxidase domain-containing protein [Terracidiphilus sp.]
MGFAFLPDGWPGQRDSNIEFETLPHYPEGPRKETLESGWKETARSDPGMITRIIVPFEGYPGCYVWHCHILEHEDNDMMRPYEVLPHS